MAETQSARVTDHQLEGTFQAQEEADCGSAAPSLLLLRRLVSRAPAERIHRVVLEIAIMANTTSSALIGSAFVLWIVGPAASISLSS